MAETLDLMRIKAKHWAESKSAGSVLTCHWCDGDWPCHVAAVLTEVERLQAQLAAQAEVAQELRAALEWALVEGGWRLWYYVASRPSILTMPHVGEPPTFTDAFLARLDVADPQAAKVRAAERAVQAGIVLPNREPA